jgi:hypothetical protein
MPPGWASRHANGPQGRDPLRDVVCSADEGGKSRCREGTLGIGIVLGEPTGVTAKLYLKDDQAIQAAVGAAFIGGGLAVHADYVWHPYVLQDRESFTLPLYVGPGVRAIEYSSGGGMSYFAIGARVVAGLLFDFKSVPLDTFVEVAPVFEYGFQSNKGAGIALNLDAGIRYYF